MGTLFRSHTKLDPPHLKIILFHVIKQHMQSVMALTKTPFSYLMHLMQNSSKILCSREWVGGWVGIEHKSLSQGGVSLGQMCIFCNFRSRGKKQWWPFTIENSAQQPGITGTNLGCLVETIQPSFHDSIPLCQLEYYGNVDPISLLLTSFEHLHIMPEHLRPHVAVGAC